MANFGPHPEGRTALYRLLDVHDRLLYIGISADPNGRWKTHRSDKPWAAEVAMRVVEWYDTRTEALSAEAAAIRSEGPRYNGTHNVNPRPHDAVGHETVYSVCVPDWVWAIAEKRVGADHMDRLITLLLNGDNHAMPMDPTMVEIGTRELRKSEEIERMCNRAIASGAFAQTTRTTR